MEEIHNHFQPLVPSQPRNLCPRLLFEVLENRERILERPCFVFQVINGVDL